MTDRDLALLLPCPRCGAAPGDRCVTVRGRAPGTPTLLHGARLEPVQAFWRITWLEARRSALHQTAHVFNAANAGHFWAQRDGIPTTSPEVVAYLEREAAKWDTRWREALDG